MLQYHFLCFGVFDLIFLDDVILVDRLHSKELFGLFPLNQQHCTKSSSSQNNFRREVLQRYLFLQVLLGKQRFSSSSDHFLLLLFTLEILLISKIVMHNIITLDLFGSLLFFLFFCGSIVDQTQLILVIDGEFVVLDFTIGLEDVVNYLLSSVG